MGGDKKCDPTKLGTWKNVGYQICGFDDKPTWADIQKRIDENPVSSFPRINFSRFFFNLYTYTYKFKRKTIGGNF